MRSTNPLFIGLLGLLVWAPLPLGSNRVWAWALLVSWACLLAMAWLAAYALGRAELGQPFRHARWALLVGALWLLHTGLQIVPLPADWVRLVSPRAFEAHMLVANALGQPAPGMLTISLEPHASRDFWFKCVAYACVFCLTLLLVDTPRRVELLLKTLVISGTLQALYASLMVLTGLEYSFFVKKFASTGIATGTFVNRNHLAGYLNLCLAAGIGLMISKLGGEAIHGWRQRLRSIARLLLGEKTRLRIYLIVMVIALVMTRSRMGNGAFFAATLIAGTLGLLLMRNAPRSTMIFLASIIALDVLIVGTWFGVDQVAKRIQGTEIAAGTDDVLPAESRDEVDRQAAGYVKDFALTGSGGGSFYVVFPTYGSSKILGFYDFAHNDYVQLVAETGIPGLILCALLVAMAAAQALLTMRRRTDALMRGTAFGIVLAISWLAIHSTVDFNMQIPANALTMTVLLALAWVAASVDRGDRAERM